MRFTKPPERCFNVLKHCSSPLHFRGHLLITQQHPWQTHRAEKGAARGSVWQGEPTLQTDGMEGLTFRLWKEAVGEMLPRRPGRWRCSRPHGPGALEPGCIVLPRLAAASSTHAPGWRGSATRPRGADHSGGLPARSPEKALGRGWGRGRRDPHSHRLPSAGGGQRGLIVSPGICPPQPPIRLLRAPSARCGSRQTPPTPPPPQPGAESFCFGGDENNDP